MSEFEVPELSSEDEPFATLLTSLGLTDQSDLQRRMAAAGWGLARVQAECKTPGARERLDAQVASSLERHVSGQMRAILASGLASLASDSVAGLTELITDPTLRRIAGEYEPKVHGGRLVCGPTGIGKSVTGAAIVRRCATNERLEQLGKPLPPCHSWEVERGHSDRFAWVRAFDLPNARLAHGLGSGEAPLVDTAMRAHFLVLDDLGWESKRASADDVLVEVIATRYDAGRVTYATTGLRLDDFQNRYGAAIVRRLTEAGRVKGKVVSCWAKEGGK